MSQGGAVERQISLSLPDGSRREFKPGVTGRDVAADIGPGLAKAALAVKLDGETLDLDRTIESDAAIEIVTLKSDDETVLELLRHDCAHVMAEAVQTLFPGTQVTIGPAIADGFYYDFARNQPFTPDDLEAIDKKMREIINRDDAIVREVWERDRAIATFADMGERYKAEIIQDLPGDEPITIYRQGDWFDLCRGPHLPSTGRVGHAFKLTKLAGAYWRGDSKNEQLQRIYGTCWRNDKELKAYLTRIEEAERRDHRRIGREMSLFHFQEEAAGMAFWHPKGWVLYRTLERYLRNRLDDGGYQEVRTPQIVDRKLWEESGHWEKFQENMYITEYEDRILAVKPMNCPCHVQIFNQGLKSYRDLPMRMAEFGSCHRLEPSGALHGLMRVRNFTQDDAHIFCTEDQIKDESKRFCDLLMSVYSDLGFDDIVIKFSDRPDNRAGEDAVWDRAEGALVAAVTEAGYDYVLDPGEGAFYGPKFDFVLRDAIGREWQCGTFQLDFVLPERLNANYVGPDGAKHRPVMLHRAIFGSMERFTGILIEHYAGRFPLWLAPTQFVICTITSDGDAYAEEAHKVLSAAGLRGELDVRNEKINLKVREHSLAKTPVILVVGKREADERTLSVRRLGKKDQEVLALDEVVARLNTEAEMPGL